MRYLLILLLPFLLEVNGLSSQDLDWAFDLNAGDNTWYYFGNHFNVDKDGNTVYTGWFLDTMDANPDTSLSRILTSGNCHDAFIARYNTFGEHTWSYKIDLNQIPGFNYLAITEVAFDGGGNIYLGGQFRGSIVFNDASSSDTLIGPKGHNDAFVVKYSKTGHVMWTKRMGGELDPTGMSGLQVTSDGDIFITGTFVERLYFNYPSKSVSTSIYGDINKMIDNYVVKLDLNGNFQWYRLITGPGNGPTFKLEVDDQKNLFLIGIPQDSLFHDSISNLLAAPISARDILLVKLSPVGNVTAVRQLYSNQNQSQLRDADLSGDGDLYLLGRMGTGSIQMDSNNALTTSLFAEDFFARYDNDLNLEKAYVFNTSAKLINADLLDCASNGNLHIAGWYRGTADFDPTPDTLFEQCKNPNSERFLAVYDTAFQPINVLTFEHFQSTSWFNFLSVRSDDDNNIYLTGTIGDSCDLDPSEDTFLLSSLRYPRLTPNCTWNTSGWGEPSTFISKFEYCQSPKALSQLSPSSACFGSISAITFAAGGNFPITYQWYKDFNQVPGANQSFFLLNGVQYSDSGHYVCAMFNECGTALSDTLDFKVRNCTGVVEWSAEDINVYPNPGKGIFYVDLSAISLKPQAVIQLIDMKGRLVIQQAAEKNLNLLQCPNTAPDGLYVLRLINGTMQWKKSVMLLGD